MEALIPALVQLLTRLPVSQVAALVGMLPSIIRVADELIGLLENAHTLHSEARAQGVTPQQATELVRKTLISQLATWTPGQEQAANDRQAPTG